ncbi:MAG TPA: quinone-dependent dihydroorotate dehydrogenase [Chthoniobacterales bacterium]|jgi:dihydroorotate dehydrogenase|nr:quinone-dependent dihydroorotate dehydrogenase [Chthoniobacterales bacterium]
MNADDIYEGLVRPLLFALSPESAHHVAIRNLRAASKWPALLRQLERFRPPRKPTKVFELTFPNPVGLAAGFDKNGVAIAAWAALGFGFVEIGTVTAKPQPGNPKPRIFRYPDQEALINRLGFNNDGADVVAARMRALRDGGRWPAIPVGINLGKSKITPLEEAVDDYLYSFRLLAPLADYVVLNVSSPNTPGLRSLQEHNALQQLLGAVRSESERVRKPVLLKIAPDLSLADLEQVIATSEQNGIAGIIATNTTLDHSAIPKPLDQAGGLSGRPLREKSTEFIRAIRAQSQLPIIASGGISDAASAREKFTAGAQLIQVYTGYVYRGPGLLREIVEGL